MIIKQMSRQVSCGSAVDFQQMSRQVSRGSDGDYQTDEQAGIARLSWRISSRRAGRCRAVQFSLLWQLSPPFWHQAPVSWKTIFPQMGEGSGLGMIQAHYIYCTLHFCYYIGSTSGHQALGPGGWGCCSIVVVSKPD